MTKKTEIRVIQKTKKKVCVVEINTVKKSRGRPKSTTVPKEKTPRKKREKKEVEQLIGIGDLDPISLETELLEMRKNGQDALSCKLFRSPQKEKRSSVFSYM